MSFEVKRRTNGIHYVEFTDESGDRKRISLGTRDAKAAAVMGRDKYIAYFRGDEAEAGADQPKRKTTFTLSQAFDRMRNGKWHPDVCSSWQTIWSDCRIIVDTIGDIEITDVKLEVLEKFVADCRAAGLQDGTIKKRLSRIRTVLHRCATAWENPKTGKFYLNYIPAFPDTVKTPKPRKQELTEDDEARVYDYCNQQMQTSNRGQQWWLFKQFITWQIDTGMRKSETLGKTMADIDGDIVMLYDGETKNDEGREIPLTTRLQKMVNIFRTMEIEGNLFGGLTSGKVFEMWDQCRTALKLTHLTIHDLRHTRGQRLADAGVPIEVIADLLGHKNIAITARVYTFRKTHTLRQWTEHTEAAGLRLVS